MGIMPAVAAAFIVAAVAIGLKLFFNLLDLERRLVEKRLKSIDRELRRLEEPVAR